jgi:hypothetical protein
VTTTAAEREALAARVLDEARARAASATNPGSRTMILRGAEARAERARAGLPIDMSYLRAAGAAEKGARPRTVASSHFRDADGAAKPTTRRPCLRCRLPFDSHGPGNRMCPACRARTADASPYAV